MHCTSCNEERLFEQFHSEPASCPDVLDGDCQEWACAVCGDALIIGLPAPAYVRADSIRAALSRRTTDPSEPRTWRTPAPVLSFMGRVRDGIQSGHPRETWCFGMNLYGANLYGAA
jgi:hypothetical protein